MTGDVSCDGKKEFATYYQAQRGAKRLNRRQDGSKGNPYRCSVGRHFHVGNTMGKKRIRQPSRAKMKGIAIYGRSRFPKQGY